MEFNEYRPIISGLLGGLVATMLCAAWAKWLPRGLNGKSAEFLIQQYKVAVRIANVAFFSGILLALYLYQWGGYASNDWHPLALGAGVAFTAPLVVLPLVAWCRRTSPAEAYVAYALNQRMPVFLLYPVMALGVPLLAYAAATQLP